jgi:hypothetical protein
VDLELEMFSRTIATFYVALSFLTSVLTAPTVVSPNIPFVILDITLISPQASTSNTQYKISMLMQHANPNATLTARATCATAWDPSVSKWPSDWISCTDTTGYQDRGAEFSWYFEYFNGIGDFKIQIKHTLLDER